MRMNMNETSICKYFKTCGNCQFLDKEYSETLKFKRDLVYKNFHNNGFDININNIIQAEENFHYRNKMIISYKLISGFYQENSHQVVDISFCVMHSSIQNEILKQLKKIFDDLKIRAYDEDTKRGLLRYVLLREAFFTKEILITIVTSSDIFPSRSEVIKRIRDISPRIKTIIQNINPRKTSIVLGEKEKILFGQGFIIDKLGDFSFRITSKSFYQVNPLQTLKLYSQIRELASFQGYETIIDAYSGVGTIGMFLSNDVREVVCVENNKQAVSAAILNAKINQIKNITFICDDATHYLKKLSQTSARIDAIIMDPPSYGRGPGGEVWKLEEQLYSLVTLCKQVLSDNPLFFILNSYTTGLSPAVMEYLLGVLLQKDFGGKVSSDEIGLKVSDTGLVLPCGSTAIWEK